MLCERCGKKEATTHIRSIINGIVYESHICNDCAANRTPQSSIVRCSCCGATFANISKSGRCGCSECYSTFYEQLLPQLKRIHGSNEYVGKKITVADRKSLEAISELNVILKKFIDEENYEQAAIVRDEIKKLKEGAL